MKLGALKDSGMKKISFERAFEIVNKSFQLFDISIDS